MTTLSPYYGLPVEQWEAKTQALIAAHPVSPVILKQAVLDAWADIFNSNVGGLRIGYDILPQPQAMGFLLHELIPMRIAYVAPGWRRGAPPTEKDLHYAADVTKSIEIKTSSHATGIFGNRSYGQPSGGRSRPKDGYFLTVNFGPFSQAAKTAHAAQLMGGPAAPMQGLLPVIVRVRFGWLDHTDWISQKSQTGQAARLSPGVLRYKLIAI